MSSELERLYGIRKPKNIPKELPASTSLAFASTLTNLLTTTPSSQQPGRGRPSKKKEDIFASHNKGAKRRAARDLEPSSPGAQVHKQHIEDVDDAFLKRSRRKLEEKAKRYRELKDGGPEDKDGLIDFDRKWADRQREGKWEHSDDENGDDDEGGDKEVEYEDEYGRLRKGTLAAAQRMERRKTNRVLGSIELEEMSVRPSMPSKLIYGDTVQVEAFNPEDEVAARMEELAAKRDRSATPPEMKHYEADKEFRIKGVGFYSFSKDETVRKEEMEALERERLETEKVRIEREQRKEERKREIEERRRAIGEKRAKKQANSFLESVFSLFSSYISRRTRKLDSPSDGHCLNFWESD
jgi:hypothetical protein